ncbi:N-formylglutamate amidohydrolase [Lentisalinibacter sediminis]|uniref:N-formylglutamate amidohydrolase n=1 Tax=Lentisalinibacter sediminis TaxID=2992237 RepID=UPI0038667643
MSPEPRLVLTSEHGTAAVPARYAGLFRGADEVLSSHRAVDPGTAELTGYLARRTGVRPHRARVTRLLVDCNRSPGHPGRFSEFSRTLPAAEREQLLERYYRPYREAVEADVARAIDTGHTALHVSVHSFARVLDGRERNADVGLLYDPGREREVALCGQWQSLLQTEPGLRVRRNYPYRGVADGLVTRLRRRFPAGCYVGIELEVCQDIAAAGGRRWGRIKGLLGDSLKAVMASACSASART